MTLPGPVRASSVSKRKGKFIERTFLGKRMIAGCEKRRIHGKPTHDQVDDQTQRVLVEEPSAHGKVELFAPFGPAKEHRGNGVHVEERTMIRDE